MSRKNDLNQLECRHNNDYGGKAHEEKCGGRWRKKVLFGRVCSGRTSVFRAAIVIFMRTEKNKETENINKYEMQLDKVRK